MKGLRLTISLFALMLIWQEPGYGLEPEGILAWVAGRMDIADAGPLPVIHYVDKVKLQAAFTRANRNSYMRWEARYGAHEAERILNIYLDELVGMFDPDTKSIYVGRFLASCQQEVILAHEITHYLQVRSNGMIDPDAHDAGNVQLQREMQASAIELRYSEHFCKDENTPETTARP